MTFGCFSGVPRGAVEKWKKTQGLTILNFAIHQKFGQNPSLAKRLIETGRFLCAKKIDSHLLVLKLDLYSEILNTKLIQRNHIFKKRKSWPMHLMAMDIWLVTQMRKKSWNGQKNIMAKFWRWVDFFAYENSIFLDSAGD